MSVVQIIMLLIPYLNPVIAREVTIMSDEELQKIGIDRNVLLYLQFFVDWIDDLKKEEYIPILQTKGIDVEKDPVKKILVGSYHYRNYPYLKAVYVQYRAFHHFDDTLSTKVIYDLIKEKLSDNPLPKDTLTFLAYQEYVKKKNPSFAMDLLSEASGFDMEFDPFVRHIEDRLYGIKGG